jgi:hypothetical protein
VAHKQYAQTDDPVFELIDGRRVAAYWVRVIPTPRQAAVLLEVSLPQSRERLPYSHLRVC